MKKLIRITLLSVLFVGLFLTMNCKKDEPAKLAVLSTTPVTNITASTATSGGNITSDGGASVTASGICWGAAANPTTSESKTSENVGTGQFVSNTTGLIAGTTYHVRAYATNSVGTSYGADLTFTTLGKAPEVLTQPATNVTSTGATLNGTVNANYLSTTVTFEYGLTSSYGETVTSAQSPVTGNDMTNLSANLSGLTPGTTYHFRIKSVNSIGTTIGNDVSFTTNVAVPILTTAAVSNITGNSATSGGNISSDGGGSISERGICWSTTANPTTSNNKTSDGTGTGNFLSDINGLNPGTLYYIRAYATNNAGTAYGNQVSFTTTIIPVVTTSVVSIITLNSATCGGNVTNEGGATVTARGVCWSTSPTPTISLNTKISVPGTTGTFMCSLTGLIQGTTYYVRAYVTSNTGTSYGTETTFKTEQIGSVTDIDGNVQKTITIGTQTWMAENLKVTKFNDGTAIPNITDGCVWYNTTTPEYCWYNNDLSTKDVYGGLYNWYTVNPSSNGGKNVCPVGWHVPTDQEWYTLELYLTDNGFGYGGSGKKVSKALAASSSWNTSDALDSPGNNQSANNITGFSAIATGGRNANNSNCLGFWYIGQTTRWWCTPVNNDGTNWAREISWFTGDFIRYYPDKQFGQSIRCLKN